MPEPTISASLCVRGFLAAVALAVPFGLCAAAADDAAAGGAGPAAGAEPAFLWNSFFAGVRTPRRPGDDRSPVTDLSLMSAGRPEAALPADFYVGYEKKLDGVTFGAAASFVAQPVTAEAGFASDTSQSSYWRFKAGARASLLEGMQLGVNVQYTPDAYAQAGDAAYLDGPAQDFSAFAHALAHNAGVNPSGYPTGAAVTGADDFRYDVGLSFSLPYQAKVDLRYYKMIEGPMATCTGACPTYFAAALQTKF